MGILNRTVIPTPRESHLTGRRLAFAGFQVQNGRLATPYALELGHALLSEEGMGRLVFARLEHPNLQAYELDIRECSVTVKGAGEPAFIYAMSTLLQLTEFKDGKVILPEGNILDDPEFETRGVNWNLFVECRGWSQDNGDGQDAFIERFISGLDTLAFFKLNAAFVDGFGWNPERFPGYGELMRRLNREARRRGVKLIFGGYNAGYGAQWRDFDGPVFRNLRSYPDGEPYPCLDPQRHSGISSTMGTCLTNPGLNALKKRNLCEFIQAVEPGMLYLHGMDIAYQEEAVRAWTTRCPECRRRWPNDDVNAVDGMAGAFAAFYDELAEAVSSVRNPESGYDAARDCSLVMISPNYTSFSENDREWRFHLGYFKTLSSCLKNKGIHLGFREQFFNQPEGGPRFAQLRETVGRDQKLMVIYFSSGSSFYNSLPVTADTACVKCFAGVNAVITGSGNAFQEPRQAITAEYLWNPAGSAFPVQLPERASNDRFLPRYRELTGARELPDTVFAENGLLEEVCNKLYGMNAGKLAAAVCRVEPLPLGDPKGKCDADGLASFASVVPLTNEMLPGYHFSVFYKFAGHRVIWSKDLSGAVVEFVSRYESVLPEVIRLTETAALNYRKAAEFCESGLPLKPEMRKAHLQRMSETCSAAVSLLGFTHRWLCLLLKAEQSVRSGVCDGILWTSIETLEQDLAAFAASLRGVVAKAVDPNGGDPGQALKTVDFLLRDLSNIRHTLKTGEYLAVETDQWW